MDEKDLKIKENNDSEPEENEPELEEKTKENNSTGKIFSRAIEIVPKIFDFIFSEKVTAVLLSIMSILISYFAWQNDTTSRIIANKELEILENDREAYFTIDCDKTVTEDDGKTYISNYTIHNDGGRISGVSIYPSAHIEIVVAYSGPSPEGMGDDSSVYFAETYMIPLPDEFFGIDDSPYKAYNSTTKSFTVYSKESINLFDFLDAIENNIQSSDKNLSASSLHMKKLKISYCNYENISKKVEYVFNDNYMYANPEENNGNFLDYKWHSHNIPFEFSDYAEKDAKELSTLIIEEFYSCFSDHLTIEE